MKNIFLVPCSSSNSVAYLNFKNTVEGDVTYNKIKSHLTLEEKKIVSSQSLIKVWGTKEVNDFIWKQMKTGDFVVFYDSGNFICSARILLPTFNQSLSKELWGLDPDDGKPWNHVYFITDVKKISIPIEVMRVAAEYESTWNKVQRFMRMRDSAVEAIIDKFGSVEKFLNQKPEEVERIHTIIETVKVEIEDKNETLDEKRIKGMGYDEVLERARAYQASGPSHIRRTGARKERKENKTQKEYVAFLADYHCQICDWSLLYKNKKGEEKFRLDVDHIVEKQHEGDEESDNLWGLCPNCHAEKSVGIITVDKGHPGKRDGKVMKNGKEIPLLFNRHLSWYPEVDIRKNKNSLSK